MNMKTSRSQFKIDNIVDEETESKQFKDQSI